MKTTIAAVAAAMLLASPVVMADSADAGHRHHWAKKHHRHWAKHHRRHGRVVVQVGFGHFGYRDCCGCW